MSHGRRPPDCVFLARTVSPSKEIKIVSAVRRSSMSSCGSSGYFSSSPTLSSSPPVLCNPKSGEWPKGSPVFGWGCGALGTCAGCVPREADSQTGEASAWESCASMLVEPRPVERKGSTQIWAEGESGCSVASGKAALTPRGALEVGWPFTIVPNWDSTLLNPPVNQSFDVGCPGRRA